MSQKKIDYLPVQAAYKHREALRAVPGSRWDPFQRAWLVPVTKGAAAALRCIPGVPLPPELAALAPPPTEMTDAISGDEAPVAPMPIKAKPYAHQVAAYNAALGHYRGWQGGFALFHEQGCGKTLTAIALMGRLALDGRIQRALVVAPLAVLPVWEKDMAAYASYPYALRIVHGAAKAKAQAWLDLTEGPGGLLKVMVINYDGLRSAENMTRIAAFAPDMVILDEGQRIKNHQSRQAKAAHAIGAAARYRLLLTGTPVGNSPLDLWSQYKFLDPAIFERSFYAFRAHYAVMGGYGGFEIIRYQHLDELTEKAHAIAHRVTKAQALDLPERIDQTLYCQLEPAALRAYRQMQRDKVAELAEGKATAPQIVTQMMRLSQITGGFLQADGGGTLTRVSRAKLSLLRETLEDLLEAGKKVVIFARFRAEIADILALCLELGGPGSTRSIWGEVASKDYGQAVEDFQTDPQVRLFVAQIQAAGAGITLHAAHTAIFYSLDYSYLNYDQAKARIHRIGQRQPCTYIHLVAQGTIDEEVLSALAAKKNIAEDIVDNWRRVFAAP